MNVGTTLVMLDVAGATAERLDDRSVRITYLIQQGGQSVSITLGREEDGDPVTPEQLHDALFIRRIRLVVGGDHIPADDKVYYQERR